MRIHRKIWRAQWDEGDYPSLPCPACNAPLNFVEDSLVVKQPDYNQELFSWADLDEALSRFAVWFVCGHSKCGEVVAVSGDCTYDYAYNEMGETVAERTFHPVAMHPAPPVIVARHDVPQVIRNELTASFGLFWVSHESCASRLRVVVELILDHEGFPAESSPGKFVFLHQRIEDWHSLYGGLSIAKSFMAIKWLGNVGSHETRVSRERLLDAYEILSRLLERLFPADEGYLDELADEIVNSKGRDN